MALALLGWATCAFVRVAVVKGGELAARDAYSAPPLAWRLGAPQPERLRRCLETAGARLPPGSRVALLGGGGLYRWRWAAYLLPQHDVLPSDAVARGEADYAIGLAPHRPAGRLVFGDAGCALYGLR